MLKLRGRYVCLEGCSKYVAFAVTASGGISEAIGMKNQKSHGENSEVITGGLPDILA
jgi:hypothetical protein